jgi:hypothetical protein
MSSRMRSSRKQLSAKVALNRHCGGGRARAWARESTRGMDTLRRPRPLPRARACAAASRSSSSRDQVRRGEGRSARWRSRRRSRRSRVARRVARRRSCGALAPRAKRRQQLQRGADERHAVVRRRDEHRRRGVARHGQHRAHRLRRRGGHGARVRRAAARAARRRSEARLCGLGGLQQAAHVSQHSRDSAARLTITSRPDDNASLRGRLRPRDASGGSCLPGSRRACSACARAARAAPAAAQPRATAASSAAPPAARSARRGRPAAARAPRAGARPGRASRRTTSEAATCRFPRSSSARVAFTRPRRALRASHGHAVHPARAHACGELA